MNQNHPTTEEIIDYLHGELSAPRDAALHAHLAECAECAMTRDGEAALTELLRTHARTQERELPYRVVARIREATADAATTPMWDRIRLALRPVVLIPAAAAVAIALYLGVGAHHPAAVTPIDAAAYVDNHAALTATAPFSEDAPIPAMLTSDDQTP